MKNLLTRKTMGALAALPMMALATLQAQTYTVTENTSAGAGFFNDYTDVVNTSAFTLTLTSNTALNGKGVSIAGEGNGNGALNFTENTSSSTTANISLAGDAVIRWNRFANLTISNAINESAAGSRLTLRGTGVNSSYAGRAFRINGAQNYTGGLTVDNAKLVLSTSSGSLPSGEIRLQNFGGFDLAFGTRTFSGKLVIDNGFVYSSGSPTTLTAQGGYEVNQGVIDSTMGLSGSVDLAKVGSGVFSLNGSNTYTGTTSVSDGTLVVNGSLTSAGSNVTVGAGGILAGTGTISRPTNIFGTHNPGNSPGIQTFGDNLSYQNGSTVNWDLIANTDAGRGTNYDGVNLTGSSNLSIFGTSTINLLFDGAGSTVDWTHAFWDANQSWLFYSLADGTVTGSFTLGAISDDSLGVALSAIREAAYFSIDTVGNDVYINYTAIPEPRMALGFGLATALLVFLRRRSRKA